MGKVASAEDRGQKQKDGDMNGIQCIYKQGCAGNYDKRGHAFEGEWGGRRRRGNYVITMSKNKHDK